MDSRAQSSRSSYTGSSTKEKDLENQLALQKMLVKAHRLESYNLYTKVQTLKVEIAGLKEAGLTQPMPTQQSQHTSRGASTSMPQPPISESTPAASPLPTDMETDQGFRYNPSDHMTTPLLLTQRPGDNEGIEYQRRLSE